MSCRRLTRTALLAWVLVAAAPGAACAATRAHGTDASISGLWLASIQADALRVPFRFGIRARAGKASGWFFNGNQRIVSTSGTFQADRLILNYPSYGRRLDATLSEDGILAGTYTPTTPGSTAQAYVFQARHDTAAVRASPAEDAPLIAGLWLVPVRGGKVNEKAWRLIVRQSGPHVSAAVLRVDGDSGALTGDWHDGKLLLSHFDGARPAAIDVTPPRDGTLRLAMHQRYGPNVILTAYRLPVAAAKGLPRPANPALHTRVRNPAQAFRFSYPDLDGHLVSSTDETFRGKVLLVDVAGSWCPNCHDEAPFLETLYRKYHRRGLDIVTLAFEEPDQLGDPVEMRAFVKQYGITYQVLIAGTPDQLRARVPQAMDLDAFPTTFFIGRDGRVCAVHAGFAGSVTGVFNTRLQHAFAEEIESLLRGRAKYRGSRLTASGASS